jgi:predicted acylesterase/phospholipase RssA
MAKALITGGGGAKGAFSVGALLALKKRGLFPFDIYSGTSTGSFIATLAAADELEILRRQYVSMGPNDILAKQNIVTNVLNGKAFLFDTYPVLQLVRQTITEQMFEKIMADDAPTLCITAVSLQTGLPTVFSNRNLIPQPNNEYLVKKITTLEMLVNALLASSSQAGFTPPVIIDGEQFVDGGHRDVIPTRIVVDMGAEDVIILSNNSSAQLTNTRHYNDLLAVVLRVIGIFLQDVRESDIRLLNNFLMTRGKRAMVIEPTTDLDEENPTGLRFNPPLMASWMVLGEIRANAVLNNFERPSAPPNA